MSNLDEFRSRVEARLAAARNEPHWIHEESQQYMITLPPKRVRFQELAGHLIVSIIRPRVTLLADHFTAELASNDPLERCSCWFHRNERFPSTTLVEFAVEHDARFEKVVIAYEMHMMPAFIKYNEHDRITTTLDGVSDAEVAN